MIPHTPKQSNRISWGVVGAIGLIVPPGCGGFAFGVRGFGRQEQLKPTKRRNSVLNNAEEFADRVSCVARSVEPHVPHAWRRSATARGKRLPCSFGAGSCLPKPFKYYAL